MVLASILRKSANSLATLAIRLTGVQRNYRYYSATAAYHFLHSKKPAVQVIQKANSDDNLLRVLDSEIQFCEESDEIDQVGVPFGFPFEIEDTPGLETITLKREYDGELIKVDVHMPDPVVTGMDNEDNDEDYKSSLPLVVMITKKDGPCLEFNCTSMLDEISIDSLALKYDQESEEDMLAYEGPDFQDLDENLQKAFHKYLEIRGIKPRTTNFLHEYMINKDNKEYSRWLKNLKNFVES
ncbi:Mitochondrial glycoprotein family protein [Corchorus capsularis]|uniref:Mitochondrial glycoprotein family protein n=1 Tax=Corchorus capsularis TaxID=210143 RepID=A0A1R3GM05_COCAP|nr:Mitochondrial glycoprotein family protein [Corchorus capsularis]